MTVAVGCLVEPRWDQAREHLAAAVAPLAAVARPISECDDLVLAVDLVALCPLPGFDTSAMDGWAVAGPGPWEVIGESLAGRPSEARLQPGQAVGIATGALVPVGADAVVRSEDGRLASHDTDRPRLHAPAPPLGNHIRRAGEECAAGDLLAPAGSEANPAVLGLAAAAGHDTLVVRARPRVALVLFGDELATAGVPGPGMVRDSLGPQLPAWLTRMGAQVVSVRHCPDTLSAHVQEIAASARCADLVMTTGGTAAGPVDHLHQAITECGGELVVDSVAVRPGHPMLAARIPQERASPVWLVGLPGNPQSAIVTLVSLVAPLLAAMTGRAPLPDLGTCMAPALGAPAHEDRLVVGAVQGRHFRPASHLGSGMLRGLATATGFAVVPPGGVPAGTKVRWLPLPGNRG